MSLVDQLCNGEWGHTPVPVHPIGSIVTIKANRPFNLYDGCSGTVTKYSGKYPCVTLPDGKTTLAFHDSELIPFKP